MVCIGNFDEQFEMLIGKAHHPSNPHKGLHGICSAVEPLKQDKVK